MLGSITPLGERGRRSRYWLTITAFVAGSTVSGAAAGLLAGLAGAALDLGGLSSHVRLPAIAIAVALGLAFDLRLGGLRLPSPRRQVNEDWLTAYRGWVYGVGFGAQLGENALHPGEVPGARRCSELLVAELGKERGRVVIDRREALGIEIGEKPAGAR